jgi:hypothetical protein
LRLLDTLAVFDLVKSDVLSQGANSFFTMSQIFSILLGVVALLLELFLQVPVVDSGKLE